MSVSNVNVRSIVQVQSFRTTGGSARDPLSLRTEFTSQKRIENQGVTIAPESAIEVDIANEGITRVDLFRVFCMTKNASFVLKFGVDNVGVEYRAPYADANSFYIGTGDFAVVRIENPSTTKSIDVEFSLFQKVD